MTYLIIMIIAFVVIMLVMFLVIFLQNRSAKSKNSFSSAASFKDTAASSLANGTLSDQASSTGLANQQRFVDRSSPGGLTYSQVSRTPGDARVAGSMPGAARYGHSQNYPDPAGYHRSLQELSPRLSYPSLPPLKPAHAQTRYELEQEYERGMRVFYDEEVGAVNFIGMHVVMNTPDEVELAFYVCKRQIRSVLRSKGLERAPTLTDIGGMVIGRDAAAAFGQALKQYLEEMCIKVDKDTYLLAHYNSQANQPDQNELQEKVRRIQFMTSAAINHFQSNIFDTREEAAAFLHRMREIYRV